MKKAYLNNIKLFWFLLLYVGFGTFSVCSLLTDDKFFGDWAFWGFIASFPVTIVSFAYRFADPSNLFPVFIIQILMFLLAFTLLSKRVES